MKISIGDFVMYERMSCPLGFEYAEVLCLLPDYAHIIVRMGGLILPVRNEHVLVAGDREKIITMKQEVDAMLAARIAAIKEADEQKIKVGRDHALKIRSVIKKSTKR